jgi:hypothetical protein
MTSSHFANSHDTYVHIYVKVFSIAHGIKLTASSSMDVGKNPGAKGESGYCPFMIAVPSEDRSAGQILPLAL